MSIDILETDLREVDMPLDDELAGNPRQDAPPITPPATDPVPVDDGLRPAVRAMVAELDAAYNGEDVGSIDKAAARMKGESKTPDSWGSRGQVAEAVKAYRARHAITRAARTAPAKRTRTAPPRPARTAAVRPAPPDPAPSVVRPDPESAVQPEPAPPALDAVQTEGAAVVHASGTAKSSAGLGWSRFGFALGVVASTAANIAHSFTPSAELVRRTNELAAATGRPVNWSDWTPPIGTIIAAAFWPIALVVSVEVISRVVWPAGLRWKAMRFGGVALVALVAAFISYKHLHGLISSYGEDDWSAAVGPLAIDGLMLVCSAALLAIGQNKRSTRKED